MNRIRRMMDNGTMMLLTLAMTFCLLMWGVYDLAMDQERDKDRCEAAGGLEMTYFGDTVCIRRDAVIQGIYK